MVEESFTSSSRPTIDFPFFKVPLEQARRVFRHSQRVLEQKLGPLTKPNNSGDIEDLIKIIEELKQTIEEDRIESRLYMEKCGKRLKFYDQLCSDDSQAKDQWEALRIDRLIHQFLLGSYYFATAESVAQSSNISEPKFGDDELYKQLSFIESKLEARSTSEALLWCFENRSHLKKSSSSLEFSLRRQTYVELTRKRDLSQAIIYAKKFFPPWLEQFKREIEQCMALLAIPPDTVIQPYRGIYGEGKWEELGEMFKKEFLDLYDLPLKPQLVSFIQAGLSSIKTPHCGKELELNLNCPVCVPPYSEIATNLPFSHHENSSIVCRISGALLDENNPPIILPNGHVYSQAALQEMASRSAGIITCPRTKQSFKISETKKLYVL